MRKRLWAAGLVAVAVAGLIGGGSATAQSQRRTFTGFIDGAEYRVEVPDRWNGTLVLYSHGYFPAGFDEPGVKLANRIETETWLREHGYAVAGSDFLGVTGATYAQAQHDQTALLDWFDANIERPRRTVALGSSSGGAMSVLLAERDPRRFAGVLSLCAPMDINGQWNTALDMNFAIKTLLAEPDNTIELVRAKNPQSSQEQLDKAFNDAKGTEHGRARLALVAALGNVPGWLAANRPRPTGLEEQLRDQITWLTFNPIGSPHAREDLEQRAGGNPSWNVGVDYGRLLARSSEADLARETYRHFGLDLKADLDALAAAPRVAPDPRALGWLYRFGVPRGTTPTPVLTLHNVADAAHPGHERWYAGQVRRNGDQDRLRQLYADRAGHCSFSAAEEIVALRALLQRIDTGRWPHLDPGRLNAAAAEFGPAFHKADDLATFQPVEVSPAFTRFTPSPALRPSR